MTTQREAFEEFYGNYQKPLVPDALAKNADGEYKHYFTREALVIWNAALSQPNEPVGFVQYKYGMVQTYSLYQATGLNGGFKLFTHSPDQTAKIKELQDKLEVKNSNINILANRGTEYAGEIANLQKQNDDMKTALQIAKSELEIQGCADLEHDDVGYLNYKVVINALATVKDGVTTHRMK